MAEIERDEAGVRSPVVVACDYRAGPFVGSTAYLTYGLNSVGRRARVLVETANGRWIARWENLKRLHLFRRQPIAGWLASDPRVARDYWSQASVDNLNRMAVQCADPAGE